MLPGMCIPDTVAIVDRSLGRGAVSFDFRFFSVEAKAAALASIFGNDECVGTAARSAFESLVTPPVPPPAPSTAFATIVVCTAKCFAIASFMNRSFSRNASRF